MGMVNSHLVDSANNIRNTSSKDVYEDFKMGYHCRIYFVPFVGMEFRKIGLEITIVQQRLLSILVSVKIKVEMQSSSYE